jgi:cytochrome c
MWRDRTFLFFAHPLRVLSKFFDPIEFYLSQREEVKPMRIAKIAALSLLVVCLVASGALAMKHKPEERGKTLFNDAKLGGGTTGQSCATCHPDGKGLEGVAGKKEWKTPGGAHKTLEEAVNTCITMALKGKALKVKSKEMKDIVAYLKSLKPAGGAEAPKKKPAMGC